MIFHHISQNLLSLREQLNIIEDDDIQAMRDAVRTKYVMFKYEAYVIILPCTDKSTLPPSCILLMPACCFFCASNRKFRVAMQLVALAEAAVSILDQVIAKFH